jgi:hypothetical protein
MNEWNYTSTPPYAVIVCLGTPFMLLYQEVQLVLV